MPRESEHNRISSSFLNVEQIISSIEQGISVSKICEKKVNVFGSLSVLDFIPNHDIGNIKTLGGKVYKEAPQHLMNRRFGGVGVGNSYFEDEFLEEAKLQGYFSEAAEYVRLELELTLTEIPEFNVYFIELSKKGADSRGIGRRGAAEDAEFIVIGQKNENIMDKISGNISRISRNFLFLAFADSVKLVSSLK